MSKISLSPSPTGSAVYTIASPAGSTDRTLTLPNNSGTLLSNASTAGFPAGSVLQVVQGYRSAEVATTSTSFIDATGVTVSITPSSTASKVLVTVAGFYEAIATGIEGRGQAKIQKNGSDLTGEASFGWYFSPDMTNDGNTYGGLCFSFLDAPSSTSSLTYTLQIRAFSSVQVKVARISITAMEIAA